jgi:alkanesulfonate monooxygenase SsuD/methylene tetrahydromethanopterin reductase-like flavin-dependent oxidoreductase (luciferase family)
VPIQLGLFVNPSAESYSDTLAMVDAAERGGFDLIGIQDHPYQRRFLDTFALIGDLLARTERLRFFPDVANLPLRHPALLAKQAASLDVMSGGRFELGLGAGSLPHRVATMGGPERSPKEGVDALEEAIPLIRAGWSGEESVTFEGSHYSVDGWEPGPPPAHPIGIWLGAYKPRMLRLTGAKADGWLPSLSYLEPGDAARGNQAIDEAAVAAGRDPREIRRLLNVQGVFAASNRGFLQGPPEQWVEELLPFVLEDGVSTFILWGDDARAIELWGGEVAPALRDQISAEYEDAFVRTHTTDGTHDWTRQFGGTE